MSESHLSLEEYLAKHDDVEFVEIIIADCNGIWRGKRVPAAEAAKLSKGFGLPYNSTMLTTTGEVSGALTSTIGSEPDRPLTLIPGSVARMPWKDRHTVQVMGDMQNLEGGGHVLSPRTVLQNIVDRFKAKGLSPVTAVELEFQLFKAGAVPPVPANTLNGQTQTDEPQCFNLEVLSDYEPILNAISDAAAVQGLRLTTFLKEEGVCQFEINTSHGPDPVAVADEALLLKRLIRGVALQYGVHASFMAKPRVGHSGNGLHMHMSLIDDTGSPVFDSTDRDSKLGHVVQGMLSHLDAAMALLAPNANSYRRFDEGFFAPTGKFWAVNNRFATVRIPVSDKANLRVEHRVAGADASPHLSMAAALAGAFLGLEAGDSAPEGLGELDQVPADVERAPTRWSEALKALKADQKFRSMFDPDFLEPFEKLRALEEQEFHMKITQAEYDQLYRVL